MMMVGQILISLFLDGPIACLLTMVGVDIDIGDEGDHHCDQLMMVRSSSFLVRQTARLNTSA